MLPLFIEVQSNRTLNGQVLGRKDLGKNKVLLWAIVGDSQALREVDMVRDGEDGG